MEERGELVKKLAELPFVQKIYPSDANFILVRVDDANRVYDYLRDRGIIVRNRNNVILCEGCLRITVGTEQENNELVQVLKQYQP